MNEILPKDLVYIIQDYAKDSTHYDQVLNELNALDFFRGVYPTLLEEIHTDDKGSTIGF
jgi:hypothetical protein